MYNKSSSILALYCLQVDFRDVEGYFFQPIPQPSLHRKLGKFQEFCLLTRDQYKTLDSKRKEQHMNLDEFIEYMKVLTIKNGKGFLRVRRMCSQDDLK